MSNHLMAADIGGTKTNIALYPQAGELIPVAERTYLNRDFYGLEPLLRQFMKETGLTAHAACFGIAGAVRDGRCDMPNLGWRVDSKSLADTFGFNHVGLLNDLEATAHGIATLTPEQLAVINAGVPDPTGNIALIAAGTGLGETMLIHTNSGMHVSASEGGHADFAPQDEEQIALLRFLPPHHEHVSWERIVSGNGLKNIYDFLKSGRRFQEPDWLAELMAQGNNPAATIAESALNETTEICVRAMEIFMATYGAEAGNLALKAMSTGGLYIGGGIAPKILPLFYEHAFISAFLNKGRFAPLLAGMPVKVILEPKTALRGAAAYLSHHF
ncbi:MAG TPA: glucokinase [Novimethylophilus sp.]|jgi:glucokinase|uniref:glucokinase n=1 Tax=Novimethylophilus sp. TaxID=2137426 RepID=UPI002F418DBB